MLVRFTGTSPLLIHGTAAMSVPKTGVTKKEIPSPEEEAERGVYRDEEGNLIFPSIAFRSAAAGSSPNSKFGKLTIKRAVNAGVRITTEFVHLLDPETGERLRDYAIDTRRAVVQRQGIMRSRARLEQWAADVEFDVDPDIIGIDALRQIFEAGGKVCGVGDFRPERSGWFGTFTAEVIE